LKIYQLLSWSRNSGISRDSKLFTNPSYVSRLGPNRVEATPLLQTLFKILFVFILPSASRSPTHSFSFILSRTKFFMYPYRDLAASRSYQLWDPPRFLSSW